MFKFLADWSKTLGFIVLLQPKNSARREPGFQDRHFATKEPRKIVAKVKLILVQVILSLAFTISSTASALTCYDLDAATIFSDENTPVYLGFFGWQYSRFSVMNLDDPDGSGSTTLSSSIRNPMGPYGNSSSAYSHNNPNATNPPRIFSGDDQIGYLTTNQSVAGGISLAEIDASCSFTASGDSRATFSAILPASLTNLVASASASSVALEWDVSERANQYRVFQCADAPCSANTFLGYVYSTETEITSLTPSQIYHFAVIPYNSFGQGAFGAVSVSTLEVTTAPDSDNDGYSDAEEAAEGTDPLDANSAPMGGLSLILIKAFLDKQKAAQ